MKRSSLGALGAALAVLVTTGRAEAQANPLRCRSGDSENLAVRGTVGERTLESATQRSNQTYGAAWLAQDRLLHIAEGVRRQEAGEKDQPIKLHSQQDGSLFFSGISMATTATFGALYIPACRASGGPVAIVPVDLISGGMSYSFALHRNVHLFYAAGVTLRAVGFDDSRWALAAAPLPLAIYSPFAIFKPHYETNTGLTLDFDYIAGVDVVSGKFGSIAVGYAGSTGFFSNLTESHVRLFAGAVVSKLAEGIDSPYLAAGVSSLDWLLGEAAVKAVGHTRLFGRRQLQTVPPPSDLIARTSDEPRGSRFTTLNLEQTEIGGVIDVIARVTVQPKPDVYEATLGAHYLVGGAFDLFAKGGVVKLPDLWFHGVEGGYKPRFEAGMALGRTVPGRHVLEVGLGVNDAEVLSVFPYAYNAFQFRLRIGI